MSFTRPRLIVLDLDGTLVDSAPDIAFSLDAMLKAMGRAPVGEVRVRGWIGNGVPTLVKRALTLELWPKSEPEDYPQALAKFMSIYGENICERSALYPGAREGVLALKTEGYTLVCLTNKHSDLTMPLLEKLGLVEYLDYVGCGNQFERLKPHPESLLKIAERFDLAPERCLMVGDSENDVGVARAAGCPIVCVSYGYRRCECAEDLGADALLDSLADLSAFLKQ